MSGRRTRINNFLNQPHAHQKSPARRFRRGLLFLDFDGTLAPIVKKPGLAKMPARTKKALKHFLKTKNWRVAIVSGRGLSDVQKKVRLPSLTFAGNHGFEIKEPKKKLAVHPGAKRTKGLIQIISKKLKSSLRSIKGVLVESKIYSLSLHTRMASAKGEKIAHKIFWEAVRPLIKKRRVRITQGKKVLEVRPPQRWNKGEAVRYLIKRLDPKAFPIYIGDDKTDEDAFRVLKKKGWGIRVGKTSRSAAHFFILNPHDMPQVFDRLGKIFSF